MTTATMDFTVPRVTTRAMIDPTRLCSLRCSFCYYLPTDDLHTVKTWEQQAKEVLDAQARGCDSCDITGGEPMQNPHVVELVKLCRETGVLPRIITSLICPEKTLDAVLDAGVEDWLISLHGANPVTHDAIVHVPRARQFQIRRMAKIAARMRYCANYVMVEANQTEMLDWAKWLLSLDHAPPKVCNFINFNAFGPWLQSKEWIDRGKANVIDPRIAGPILDDAIDMLEEAGVGVNVRYIPMCAVAERHRKNVCNDLVVALDAGEWDNAIPQVGGRTLAQAEHYGRSISRSNELQTQPCTGCGLKPICGGANKIWHKLACEKFGTEVLTQLPAPSDLTSPAYWHYRQHNVLGLDPRRPS